MSRSFLLNTDHLDVSSATVTGVPMAMALWLKRDPSGLGVSQEYFVVGVSGTPDNRFFLFCGNPDLGACVVRDAASNSASQFGNVSFPASVWQVMSCNFLSNTSRTYYWNGRKASTDTTNKALATSSFMRISGDPQATPASPAKALIAHVALWNTALSDDDHLRLAERSPDKISPANLVEYWPLTGNNSPEPSLGTSPHAMTVFGTTYSQDNPVFIDVPMVGESGDYF